MSASELRTQARQQLGNNLFCNEWLTALGVAAIAGAISAVASMVPFGVILVAGPLGYGMTYTFLKQSRQGGSIRVEEVFRGFQDDFGGTLVLGLLSSLFVTLWSMLFVIPGIIKAYAYSQAFFIKADHIDYDWRTCLDESIRMMEGRKMDLFFLDLSFIGWYILGAICFGIGSLWVIPYHTAARTQFYNSLLRYPG